MRLGPSLIALSLSLTAATAWAEGPVPSLDLRGFHPPVDPAGFLYLEPTKTPGGGEWNFGAYASYALSPVVLRAPGDHAVAKVVSHQVSLDYYGNVGIGKTWAVMPSCCANGWRILCVGISRSTPKIKIAGAVKPPACSFPVSRCDRLIGCFHETGRSSGFTAKPE